MALAITATTPQVLSKPISVRGRARLRSRRRRRRMRRMPEMALFKHNGGLKKEGQRPIALVAPIEVDTEEVQLVGLRYRNCTKFWEGCRLTEEMRELRQIRCQLRRERKAIVREGARQMCLLETALRAQADRELRPLYIPAFLFAKVEELAGDPDIGDLQLAIQLETIDVLVLAHQAA